jgi:hypothetical protein
MTRPTSAPMCGLVCFPATCRKRHEGTAGKPEARDRLVGESRLRGPTARFCRPRTTAPKGTIRNGMNRTVAIPAIFCTSPPASAHITFTDKKGLQGVADRPTGTSKDGSQSIQAVGGPWRGSVGTGAKRRLRTMKLPSHPFV